METPMKHTLGQAAKECQVSKSTLSRWIKKGRISAEPQEDGSFLIDASELNRIKELQQQAVARNGYSNPAMQQMETPRATNVLQVEIEMLRERLSEKDATIRELRQDKERAIEDLQKNGMSGANRPSGKPYC
jgi:DNA-binding transcriptional MerR regulator